MAIIGTWAVPIMLAAILLMGLIRGVKVFDSFLEGAESGIKSLFRILPSLVGLVVAVEMFKASGALDVLTSGIEPVASFFKIPADVMPMAILRPISGGGSIALLDRILNSTGPDSLSGRVASVLCGSSETTFYTITVYFGAVGVTRTRHTIIAALAADCAAVLISSTVVRLLF